MTTMMGQKLLYPWYSREAFPARLFKTSRRDCLTGKEEPEVVLGVVGSVRSTGGAGGDLRR
jgi:hypothetical protein